MVGPVDSHAAFLALVKQLRALGAVRVRDGSLEVAFSGSPVADEPLEAGPRVMVRASLTGDERAEIEALRAFRQRQEELGLD